MALPRIHCESGPQSQLLDLVSSDMLELSHETRESRQLHCKVQKTANAGDMPARPSWLTGVLSLQFTPSLDQMISNSLLELFATKAR